MENNKPLKSESLPASYASPVYGSPSNSPTLMRSSEKRRKNRPSLVSSRTNSRPQLPRYANSSTLPIYDKSEDAGSNFNSQTRLEREFEERREAMFEEIRAMTPGTLVEEGTNYSCEDGLRMPREFSAFSSVLSSSSTSSPSSGAYTAYSDFPSLDATPSAVNYSSNRSDSTELSRLELFHQYLADLANHQELSSDGRIQKYDQLISYIKKIFLKNIFNF
jgi:hypothetical protein